MSTYRAMIQLLGPFTMTADDGTDLIPKSAKARGLLALLATSPQMTRPRRWLEEKLWSDRAQEQAGASMRQTLSELRKVFAAHPSLLRIDRENVSLAASNITIADHDSGLEGFEDRDFLEGLDVKDPEFENWLAGMRARHSRQAVPLPESGRSRAERPLIVECLTQVQGDRLAEVIADSLCVQIGESIAGQVQSRLRAQKPGPDSEADVQIKCQVVEVEGEAVYHIRAMHVPTGDILYAKSSTISETSLSLFRSDGLAQTAFEASELVIGRLASIIDAGATPLSESKLISRALPKLFSFEPDKIRTADYLLAKAYEVNGNPSFLAWRALARNIQAIELPDDDPEPLKAEASQLIARAIADGPDNALVLSLASLVRIMLLDDALGALDLARPAVEGNSNSAFALQAIAMADMLTGDKEQAYHLSRRSHQIAGASRYGHWWDLFHSLACISSGRYEEAVRLAESAVRRAPQFRPPLRNLIALYAHLGKPEEALRVRNRLMKIETGFSITRFLEDDKYPNRTVRLAGLLDLSRGSMRTLSS
ncbi:transcriptional regulator [Oricola cellulosilytica]|uniref:Transcriptional regulator n=1 Tax=Oricola cellulosilytica TaxID=1429082 RepID=A0A4R0PCR7_9HYPH|nr:transcriptional regulator [Oricola cellulosilytica]TCD15262.1 transcriptional regulator [Oricola cellulosilytica]